MLEFERFPTTRRGSSLSPDDRIARIAVRQHAAFTRAQAVDAGFTDGMIKQRRDNGRWATPHRGVYVLVGAPATWEQRVIAATLLFGGVASSITAGRLLGILDRGYTAPIHVTLPSGQKRSKRKGIVLHQATLARTDVRRAQNIPVTAPNRTLVDLAGALGERALEAPLDDAIQLGLTTIPALYRYISDRNLEHSRGVKALRRVLDDRAKGATHRELERRFRRKLKASGLPEPVRRYPLGGYHIDFVYPTKMIAIELDGLGGHFSAEAFRRDKRRGNEIVLAGFDLFHFTWDDVNDRWPEVEKTIRTSLGLAI